MSIEGSINVSALFHDRDGTTAMKVVSLRSSNEYTTGKVAIITGTAGTAANVIGLFYEAPFYVDAQGNPVSFISIERIAFSWSGNAPRKLIENADSAFVLQSRNGQVSVSSLPALPGVDLTVGSGSGTGTYTILLYGT